MNLKNLKYEPLFKSQSKKALDTLNTFPFPHRTQENWKYAKLGKVKKTNFHNDHSFNLENLNYFSLPISKGLTVVIENGKLNQKLSNIYSIKGFELSSYSDKKNNILDSIEKFEKKYNSYFSFLNQSYLDDGIFIKVDDNCKIHDVINIVYINSVENCLVNTRLHAYVGEKSSIQIKQFFVCKNGSQSSLTNHISEFDIEKYASCKVDKFQNIFDNFNICSEYIKQDESSHFVLNTFSNSGKIIRNDIGVDVLGKHCHTELNGIFSPSDSEYIDQHTTINHLVSNCNSFENYKGIIRGNGVGVFNGKVIVHKDAQQIEAFQQNNNVLIDDNSTIYSKPELEIYADDVKCSHGSTTGQFDDQALFYLRSRGITRTKAIDLLTTGFVNEVIGKVSDEDLKNFLLKTLISQ
jgi:Fe-S cluster assembly protein SufD